MKLKRVLSVFICMMLIATMISTLCITTHSTTIDYQTEMAGYNLVLKDTGLEDELTLKDAVTLLLRLEHINYDITLQTAKKYKVITCEDYTEKEWNSKVTRFTLTEMICNYCRQYNVDVTEINTEPYMDDILADWLDTPEMFGKTTKVVVRAGIMGRQSDDKFNGKGIVTYGQMLDAVYRIVSPEQRIRLTKIEDFSQLLSEYSTKTTKDANRNFNINKASEAMNGCVLQPGETFSYYKTIGNPGKNAGYKESTVISGGKYVKGYGGGVCQNATTLFNAVLRANLEIVERRAHGLKSSYVSPGFDATFASGSIDFKFKNTLDRPIKIVSTFDKDTLTLTVQLYGSKKEQIPEVKLYTIGKRHSWTLFREVNGEVNYNTQSYYKD